MDNAYAEPVLTNAALSDLVKIPTKDFEEKFREWMERDEVTRSLQAKLRRDLITNFNKTALGRHIMSNSGVYGGGKTQRLTLSPVVLALNTLVAEFLYAENCHYTLSVFCTEVPFRNTLPDFDGRAPFRFAPTELNELLAALASSKAVEQELSQNITAKYTATDTSLLFLIVEYLLANLETKTLKPKQTEQKSTMTKRQENSISSDFVSKKDEMEQLNNYLLKLSRKMETMLENVQNIHKGKKVWKLRSRAKKNKTINRSLEHMTQQLKKLSHEKIYNKQMKAVLIAINKLGNQFESCANNFAQIYEDTKLKDESKLEQLENEKEHLAQFKEKTYSDWLHEMRETRNGKKFLTRVESSLMKALDMQKAELRAEVNEKLEQQKTLLKIRYKQKLIDHIAKQPTTPMDEVFSELQLQLKELHLEYNKLLQKFKENEETKNNQTENLSTHKVETSSLEEGKKTVIHEKQIHSIMENLQTEEECVSNLLEDAKKQLMALDEENNQIEQQVSTCLALLGKKPFAIINEPSTREKNTKPETNYKMNAIQISEEDEMENVIKPIETPKNMQYIKEDLKFENAISNAKKEFFEYEEKRKKQMLELEIQLSKEDMLINQRLEKNAVIKANETDETLSTESRQKLLQTNQHTTNVILQKSAEKLNRLFSTNAIDKTFISKS